MSAVGGLVVAEAALTMPATLTAVPTMMNETSFPLRLRMVSPWSVSPASIRPREIQV